MSLTVPLPEFLTADSPLSSSGRSIAPPARSTRRSQTGRALEVLAHAIEYLEDTAPLSLESCARSVAVNEAVQILASLNRNMYAEAPLKSPARSRLGHTLRRLLPLGQFS